MIRLVIGFQTQNNHILDDKVGDVGFLLVLRRFIHLISPTLGLSLVLCFMAQGLHPVLGILPRWGF